MKKNRKIRILDLWPLVVNLHARFEVSISNCSQDMEAVPKFQKAVTWPLATPSDLFFIFIVSAPYDESACQIWSF